MSFNFRVNCYSRGFNSCSINLTDENIKVKYNSPQCWGQPQNNSLECSYIFNNEQVINFAKSQVNNPFYIKNITQIDINFLKSLLGISQYLECGEHEWYSVIIRISECFQCYITSIKLIKQNMLNEQNKIIKDKENKLKIKVDEVEKEKKQIIKDKENMLNKLKINIDELEKENKKISELNKQKKQIIKDKENMLNILKIKIDELEKENKKNNELNKQNELINKLEKENILNEQNKLKIKIDELEKENKQISELNKQNELNNSLIKNNVLNKKNNFKIKIDELEKENKIIKIIIILFCIYIFLTLIT